MVNFNFLDQSRCRSRSASSPFSAARSTDARVDSASRGQFESCSVSITRSPMQRLLQFIVSYMTLVVAIHADGSVDAARCDFMTVIDVANQYFSGCRDLYNVLRQSVPVNYTSTLCDDSDCMAAINKLRAMELGDCIVFGSTTLTSDILDQCKDSKSTVWVGWLLLALSLLAFIPVVVYRVQYYRKKKIEAQLDVADGKLGINDAPYKVIDLAGTRV